MADNQDGNPEEGNPEDQSEQGYVQEDPYLKFAENSAR